LLKKFYQKFLTALKEEVRQSGKIRSVEGSV